MVVQCHSFTLRCIGSSLLASEPPSKKKLILYWKLPSTRRHAQFDKSKWSQERIKIQVLVLCFGDFESYSIQNWCLSVPHIPPQSIGPALRQRLIFWRARVHSELKNWVSGGMVTHMVDQGYHTNEHGRTIWLYVSIFFLPKQSLLRRVWVGEIQAFCQCDTRWAPVKTLLLCCI